MRVIDKVTGTTRSTVVTLSKNAEPSAVSKEREIKILIDFLALLCCFNGNVLEDARFTRNVHQNHHTDE